jgi:hypothetical protein
MQNKIRKYLSYIWETDHSFNLGVITSKLSPRLKYEFTIEVNGRILAFCPILCNGASQQFLKNIT